ncbi:MAG: histidinol-phosphatase HisJ family protein [Syntrophomonadaceae bacterium]|nr:histidinol-phosphatase HisJ family protein [Syntrophomonadaceae bacterium]
MLVDYHVHALAHGEYEADQAWLSAFVDKACQMGIIEMGFSEHDEFIAGLDLDIFQKLKMERQSDISLRLGIEIDYIPGIESDLIHKLSQADYDYSIGSIHYIDGWAFDHPDHKQGFFNQDIDEIYIRYAQILLQMVTSRLFDIVGHIDLVKIWGHRPQRKKAVDYLLPVVQAIKRTGMVVEINSAGLRKPVGELYPAGDLLALLYSMNIPVTLGSDAHHPQQMGEGLEEARAAARRAGYRTVIGFEKHRPTSILL